MEHINKIQRDLIASRLSHKKKLIDIANELDLDPTSISKEIKRNRIKKWALLRMMPTKEY